MEDITIGLLYVTLKRTSNLLKDGNTAEADDMLEEVCDILESYLTEGE